MDGIENSGKNISNEYQIQSGEIAEIKERLSKIDNLLIINFDETLTKDITIANVIENLKNLLQDPIKANDLDERYQKHRKINQELKADPNSEFALAERKGRSGIKYFYEEVMKDIDRDLLDQAYNLTCKQIAINPNFIQAVEFLKQQNDKPINLAILSLNSTNLLKKYIEHYQEFLKKHDIQIVEILGNEIIKDKKGNVAGINELVTKINKKQYIPENAIMLADDSETGKFLENNVNAVNVQGEKYYQDCLRLAQYYAQIAPLQKRFSKDQNIQQFLTKLIKARQFVEDKMLLPDLTEIEELLQQLFEKYGEILKKEEQ